MPVTHHIDGFIKAAEAALAKPATVGDAQRASGGYNRNRQEYAQPQPPSDSTNPNTVSTQKSLQPPPVM